MNINEIVKQSPTRWIKSFSSLPIKASRKVFKKFFPASFSTALFNQLFPNRAILLSELENEKILASFHNHSYLAIINEQQKLLQECREQIEKIQSIDRHLAIEPFLNRAKITYSQAGEDRLILFICNYFQKLQYNQLTYLDLGANDPEVDSNTYLMYLSHCKGVLVEPNPDWYSKIKSTRPRDVVLNMGIGFDQNSTATFYLCDKPGLSTFSKERSNQLINNGHSIQEIPNVPLITFNKIIEDYFGGTAPDFVSIDIEGIELDILKTIDWHKYRPKIFCIESNMESFKYGHPHPIISYLESKQYFYIANTGINMIFIASETFDLSKD